MPGHICVYKIDPIVDDRYETIEREGGEGIQGNWMFLLLLIILFLMLLLFHETTINNTLWQSLHHLSTNLLVFVLYNRLVE